MSITLVEKASAFRRRIRTYALLNSGYKDINIFFSETFKIFELETNKILRDLLMLKVNSCLEVKFVKRSMVQNSDNENSSQFKEEEMSYFFQTKNEQIVAATPLENWFKNNVVEPINRKISEFLTQGSGWSLSEIVELCINNNKYVCFNGASYIKLPKEISNKKAVINIQNNDEKCFVWAVLSALKCNSVKKNAHRVSNYRSYLEELDLTNIEFPVTLNQIDIFEKNNEEISINVYIIENDNENESEKKQVVPVRLTKRVKKNHIHLLLLCATENDRQKRANFAELIGTDTKYDTHYCWIKDLSKLISSDVSKHKAKIHVCDRCLHFFYTERTLREHVTVCEKLNFSKITLPSEDEKWCFFNKFERQLEVPFIIYADIEAILTETANEVHEPKGAYQKHVAHSIGYYFHSRLDSLQSYYESCNGLNCIEWFCMELRRIVSLCYQQLNHVKPMLPLTLEQIDEHNNAKCCYICQNPFLEDEKKIFDHSHLTGKYRGPAHNSCNLNYKESKIIPVVFHNLQYDLHFLIEEIAESCNGSVDIIPINKEKYISFTKKYSKRDLIMAECDEEGLDRVAIKLRFIDSYRFMSDSLAKLASYLPKNEFTISRSVWKNLNDEKFDMIIQKGVYPYDYMDSAEKFNETNLPSIDCFYNKLNDSNITQNDYEFAQKIWNNFKIKNMQEYTDVYLKSDVALLADIFESFRKQCMLTYGLDPAHYFTTPGFSWDAMLKCTRVRIELITNVDHMLFIERGK